MDKTQKPTPGSSKTPLLPITDLLGQDISSTASSISSNLDRAVTDGLQKAKSTENERVTTIINEEITQLAQKQENNNEEIRKRVADLQSLREKNLVVAGAVSGLRKILESIEKK